MNEEIIDSPKNISTIGSNKIKSQEVGTIKVDSIKKILTSIGEEIILTDEQIQNITNNEGTRDGLDNYKKEIQFDNIRIITNCLRNMDRTKIKDFIKRKKEYLEKNRTISKEKFEELFGGSGKYGKTEINQTDLGLCFMYSGIELLKKSNGFDEIIQTNLKETSEGWKVKLPTGDTNGYWFKVNKNEIDQKIDWYGSLISINSKSDLLGFKILEIACIKKFIYNKFTYGSKRTIRDDLLKAKNEFNEKGDFELNGKLIEKIWDINDAIAFMEYLFGNSIISHRIEYSAESYNKDYAFNAFQKGLLKITVMFLGNNDNIKDIKVYGYQKKNHKRGSIISYNSGWKGTKFVGSHVYSIEKCYINPNTGEKRVWIINPRYTRYKFDISLEDCKQNFERDIIGIDIDKMFR